jgi:deoxyribodipyrimidine photo-lyase
MVVRASAPSLAPPLRVTACNDRPVRARGAYVLYWMIAARRTSDSHALDHALARAAELDLPLLVLEPLRAGYRWASDRLHRFVLDGMAANARAFAAAGITYHPYVEPAPGAGRGLLAELAKRAALVVTDEQPGFFLPRMVAAAAAALDVRVEQVDGNGLLPLRAHGRAFPTAAAFRWQLQRELPAHLSELPHPAPLAHLPRARQGAELAATILRRWPAASAALLAGDPAALAALPIDHAVPIALRRGGAPAALAALRGFVADRLDRYGVDRSQPDDDVASGLSPYLHFGHVGAAAVARAVWAAADWAPSRLAPRATGKREGWWGAPPAVESFLDELITWRELGHGFCFHRDDFDRYESLPDWARGSLDGHAGDPRPHRYDRATLEAAATHDPLWNAAQTQLVREGTIHNYLRMLWGKKILEWSPSPRAALAVLIELNNRHALDGRDPNSYSGIFWTLGRFDRPWAPERPIFGVIRYMASVATARKLRVKGYLARYAPIDRGRRRPRAPRSGRPRPSCSRPPPGRRPAPAAGRARDRLRSPTVTAPAPAAPLPTAALDDDEVARAAAEARVRTALAAGAAPATADIALVLAALDAVRAESAARWEAIGRLAPAAKASRDKAQDAARQLDALRAAAAAGADLGPLLAGLAASRQP